ncbi:hypothetical protein [Nocardioides sp.]|uniref:hypothetical protein n=1 Tax=Nocardioides sp. TaxID=35761 RepID=UPI0025D4D8FF|nr:hypothetical protein [Nocardioides sp.]
MAVTDHLTRATREVVRPTQQRTRVGDRRWATSGLLLAAVVAVAAWLPFLERPLSPDESGFLLLAQHWHHGSSLYGDYWVDRPPLLLWLFSLAGHLGPTHVTSVGVIAPGVKIMGAAASGAAVLLTGVLARQVAPRSRWSRTAAVVLAAALLSSPLLGMPETNGEVLAVPFVLLGTAGVVAALRRPWGRTAALLTAGAGASAMAGALVKQNVVDVFVFAAVAAVVLRHRVDRLRARMAGFAAGAVAVLGLALAGAWAQGTTVAGLWDAIVVFRLEASDVIGTSASEATSQRMTRTVLAFFTSGAGVVLAVTLVIATAAVLDRLLHDRRSDAPGVGGTTPSFASPAAALVAWELCAAVLGGSYWLHYLTGVVPGLVTVLALTGRSARPRTPARRAATLAVAYTLVAGVAVWAPHATAAVSVSSDAQVITYLREHAAPGDGVVVGFGHPDIVAGSGLSSPYEQLWSLPVRVRDPDLAQLQRVLAGPTAPRWVVVAGDSLETWGLDPAGTANAQRYLQRHYREDVTYGDWHIWQRQEGGAR